MNNELYHYGVLGMKWGVRRYQPYETVPRKSGKQGKEIGEARKVDPNIAKNKQTRRAAIDYNNLTNDQFRRKYKVNKKKFERRYARTKGDTYSLGKRKALVSAFIVANSKNNIHYYDWKTKSTKTIKTGKAAAAKMYIEDRIWSEAITRFGNEKAEKKYSERKS